VCGCKSFRILRAIFFAELNDIGDEEKLGRESSSSLTPSGDDGGEVELVAIDVIIYIRTKSTGINYQNSFDISVVL